TTIRPTATTAPPRRPPPSQRRRPRPVARPTSANRRNASAAIAIDAPSRHGSHCRSPTTIPPTARTAPPRQPLPSHTPAPSPRAPNTPSTPPSGPPAPPPDPGREGETSTAARAPQLRRDHVATATTASTAVRARPTTARQALIGEQLWCGFGARLDRRAPSAR